MNLRTPLVARAGVATCAVAAASVLIAPATASADTGYTLESVPAGVVSGGELAIDQGRDKLFITDNNAPMQTTGSDVIVTKSPVDPAVSVFDTTSGKPVRKIDLSNQPGGMMLIGKVPAVPTPQVPDGIAVDTKRARVLVTNAHANGVTVFGENTKAVTPKNLTSLPESHPMGAAADEQHGKFYVGLNAGSEVAVFDSASGRKVKDIKNLPYAAFVDVDESRHRAYVGSADYESKKNNFVAVIDTDTDTVVKKIPVPNNARPKVDPATGKVWVASFATGKIVIIDPDSLSVVQTIETTTTPAKLAIDSVHRRVYTSNLQKKTITVLGADSGAILTTLKPGVAVHTLAVDEKTGIVYGTQHMRGDLTVVTPN
ncbi:MAG: YncE family protein [Gordonia sp. (in: high G+C Gram-positive bacteria)]|uniref:YncE family protein n=1 Tax=Gordonia sp. (in: high G+C Gram-positive bacteria) TaxID=84139 RepID=UPI0039E3912D